MSVRQPRRFGGLPDRPDPRDVAYAPTAAARPAVVDLRAQCPPVYDQGDLGSCTANAIAGALQFDRTFSSGGRTTSCSSSRP